MTTLPLHQIKEKNKHEDKPPFFDFNSLRSRTIQTIMISSALMATGLYTPLIYMVSQSFNPSNVLKLMNVINTFDSTSPVSSVPFHCCREFSIEFEC